MAVYRKWKKPETKDVPSQEEYQIRIRGNWSIIICDTQNGELRKEKASYKNGWTVIKYVMDLQDSLLLKLGPLCEQEDVHREKQEDVLQEKQEEVLQEKQVEEPQDSHEEELQELQKEVLQGRPGDSILEELMLAQPMEVKLDEPNVLLLDQGEYLFDDGEWNETEEILKIDNQLRERLGYPKRMEAWAQPWVQSEEEGDVHIISLRFRIQSEEEFSTVFLAMEDAEKAHILWNGREIKAEVCGWFVDECLKKIPLGNVKKGDNILDISIPFGRKTNLEWCYLLGDFGVRVAGRNTMLISMPKQIYFGDYTVQGLPFYAGNIIYRMPAITKEGFYKLRINKFRAPLLKVSVDQKAWKAIAYAPYEADLGYLSEGSHEIEILSFGNRVNAFGAIHNCDETTEWFGPDAWRSAGDRYAYEYQLKRMGILKTPVLLRYQSGHIPENNFSDSELKD